MLLLVRLKSVRIIIDSYRCSTLLSKNLNLQKPLDFLIWIFVCCFASIVHNLMLNALPKQARKGIA